MIHENKVLLLKDLSARLPYNVVVEHVSGIRGTLNDLFVASFYNEHDEIYKYEANTATFFGDVACDITKFKPYLFPLSSMTEEQKNYIRNRFCYEWESDEEISDLWRHKLEFGDALEFIQWCYENHLDINSLIPMGLANDATNLDIYG